MLDTDTLTDTPTQTGAPLHADPDGVFIAPEHPYIARTSQYVLKSGDTFVVNDPLGDINGVDDGLFVNDTRMLSQLRLTFGGRAPSLLSGNVSSDNTSFTAHLTNRPLPPLGGEGTPEGVIHVERMRVLCGTVLYEAISLTNYGFSDAVVPLSISFASDFKDMFEVRGLKRTQHGSVEPTRVGRDDVKLAYVGLDHVRRHVDIAFAPAPDHLFEDRADYTVELPAHACVSIYLSVAAHTHAVSAAQGTEPLGVQIAQPPHLLQPGANTSQAARAPACHERLTASRGLVVEENSVHREHVVRLAIVDGRPVRVHLCGAVRRARMERRLLVLRRWRRAEHLRARRLVKAGGNPRRANRLKQPNGAKARDVTGVIGHLEADLDVALRAQVVDLVGLHLVEQVDQADAVVQVALVQAQPHG